MNEPFVPYQPGELAPANFLKTRALGSEIPLSCARPAEESEDMSVAPARAVLHRNDHALIGLAVLPDPVEPVIVKLTYVQRLIDPVVIGNVRKVQCVRNHGYLVLGPIAETEIDDRSKLGDRDRMDDKAGLGGLGHQSRKV